MKELLREYMDYSDSSTIKYLTHLNEGGNQNQFLVSLTSKLYDKIQEKATRIDFSSVEMSRGDITKIQNYKQMMECLDIMKRIVMEYKENTAPVDTVIKAEENLRARIRMFKKAYAIGSSLPILTYNSIALAMVEATSFLISVCVEYVKDPAADSFQMALDITAYNKTRQNLLFNTLDEFNKSCATRELDNAMEFVMGQAVANRESALLQQVKEAEIEKDHPFLTDDEIEAGATSVIHDDDREEVQEGVGTILSYGASKVLLWICKKFIPVIRAIVYWYFLNKQKISDYYADQADMLQMNAMLVQNRSDIPEAERKAIYARQMKIVERYRKRSNEMSIDYMVAKKGSEKIASDEAKKFKAEEVQSNDYGGYASIFECTMNDDLGELVFESPFEFPSIDERTESLDEAFLFISKEARDLKKKLKEAVKAEFASYYGKGIGSRIAGAFNGSNSKEANQAYQKALNKMLQIVPESKAFGPCRRERTYQAGNTIVTETYYVYVIYGMLKDKLIKIDFECGTSSFSFNENSTIIPKNMIKEIFNINGSDSDLHINKNSAYTIDKGAVFKSKDFANKVLAKAQSLGINAELDLFKSTVKFK